MSSPRNLNGVGIHLATSALAALEKANLGQAGYLVKQRMLDQPHLTDEEGVLLPMVELALYHIRDIARKSTWSNDEKFNTIYWTLTMAGF